MCVRLLERGKGVALDQAGPPPPPVVNSDPIGHDAQSAAEILNENSCTNSLTPSKRHSRPAGILHTNGTFFIRGCGSVLHKCVWWGGCLFFTVLMPLSLSCVCHWLGEFDSVGFPSTYK